MFRGTKSAPWELKEDQPKIHCEFSKQILVHLLAAFLKEKLCMNLERPLREPITFEPAGRTKLIIKTYVSHFGMSVSLCYILNLFSSFLDVLLIDAQTVSTSTLRISYLP